MQKFFYSIFYFNHLRFFISIASDKLRKRSFFSNSCLCNRIRQIINQWQNLYNLTSLSRKDNIQQMFPSAKTIVKPHLVASVLLNPCYLLRTMLLTLATSLQQMCNKVATKQPTNSWKRSVRLY